MPSLDPKILAKHYVKTTRTIVETLSARPKVLGLIASKDEPSLAYARATQQRFIETGMIPAGGGRNLTIAAAILWTPTVFWALQKPRSSPR